MPQKGSVLGGTLLVAGCCIGAGMLGLPVVTAFVGLIPTFWMLFVTWAYMCCTGLLLLEVNLWYKDEISMVSMSDRTIGRIGKWVAWATFLFLFYSLMVAYVAGCGELFSDFFKELFAITAPAWTGSLFFALLFGAMIYFGTYVVDKFNRLLMLGLIITYLLLLILGFSEFKLHCLSYQNWAGAPFVLPVMVILYGFHNLVPSLTTYLGHDSKRLVLTIVLGSLIPFFVYLLWELLILGLITAEGSSELRQALSEGDIATRVLRQAVGKAWVVDVAEYFGFFALVTSFLTVALGFVDFLADGLRIPKSRYGSAFLCFLVLGLPFLCSLIYPNVFINALEYGGFAAVVLFGLLPAAMVWVGRYKLHYTDHQIVPGGRFSLILIILFSLLVMALLILQKVKG